MFNNPYLYQTVKPGIFARLFRGAAAGGINWSGILSNTQKSLGIINQAIPLVYQVKPIINNAKTMFKIAGAMKEDTSSNNDTNIQEDNYSTNNSSYSNNENKPIFYI